MKHEQFQDTLVDLLKRKNDRILKLEEEVHRLIFLEIANSRNDHDECKKCSLRKRENDDFEDFVKTMIKMILLAIFAFTISKIPLFNQRK